MRSGPRFVLDRSAAPQPEPIALDPEQQRVVEHRSGPLLVLAGPGTGKTTTIVEAVAARILDPHDPVAPDRILALTFGKRAAGELRDRVVARLGGGALPTVSTFHAFAYGLLRQVQSAEEYRDPPRLLSGAEEDVRMRELLTGAVADGTIDWPDDLAGAITTLGFANEVRAVIARAKALGIDPDRLAAIGRSSDRPAWQALGVLAHQESEVMSLEHVLDYVELLHRTVLWAYSAEGRAYLDGRFRAVFVDELQDTDPLQMALLRALAASGASIVAVGDPDQSIYAFRGAQVGGLLTFPEQFRRADGAPAPIVVLRRTRRFGPQIRAAANGVLGRRSLPGLDPQIAHAHRTPTCEGDSLVLVRAYDSESARAAHVAEDIRRAHLREHVAWRDMAVLVRSSHAIGLLQRALQQAGVPVAVAADEIPLRAEPAVAALLDALEIATHPTRTAPGRALDVLTGPIGGLDPSQARHLGRALRTAARAHDSSRVPAPSDELIRDVVIGVLPLPPSVPDDIAEPVRRLVALIQQAHAQVSGASTPAAVLWTLWSGGSRKAHGWPARLRDAALSGSRSAHHDLDAIIALFDTAERTQSRYRGVIGVGAFIAQLHDQQIPAEPIAERGVAGDVVRVLTAHRAKGLEWDRVWIVGAEEGVWPDLRSRGSILEPDRLTVDGVGEPARPAELLAEERRLFFVALTRARDVVTVAALAELGDSGPQPSRFVDDLGIEPERIPGRPVFTASLLGLVAELRTVLADPQASAALREAAARRLGLLASARDDHGNAIVPMANPDAWWGTEAVTERAEPIRDPAVPVALSGSRLEGLLACPLKWFLEHDVHADVQRGAATKFGSVVHAVADHVAKGDVPAQIDAMDTLVDRIWRDMRFDAPWQSAAERAEARDALTRFAAYHLRAERALVSTEEYVTAEVEVPTPEGGRAMVRLSGYLDRIERNPDGGVVAIDLKNMRRGIPDNQVPEHAQLGVYQLILRQNGYDVDGAALVQLRIPAGKGSSDPKVQLQGALGDESPTWIERELGAGAAILQAEGFRPTVGPQCQYCSYERSCPSRPAGGQVTP